MQLIVRSSSTLFAAALAFGSGATGDSAYYTFSTKARGGVAAVRVDPESGAILEQRALFEAAGFRGAHELALSDDGRVLAAVAKRDRGDNGVLCELEGGATRAFAVPGEPDDICAAGERFLVGSGDGAITAIARDGSIAARAELRELLEPGGSRPEDLAVLEQRGVVLATLHQDSDGQEHHGNRVAVLALDDLKLRADLKLPRTRTELHDEHDDRERGPGPEIVLALERSNTLLVSLDLYGSVLCADLDAALEGELAHQVELSTAADGSFGTAFPDRVCVVEDERASLVFVFNAGKKGGAAIVDLRARQVIAHADVPPGLYTPTWVRALDLVVAAPAGKAKWLTEDELAKQHDPSACVFFLSVPRAPGAKVTVEMLALPFEVTRVVPVGGAQRELVLAFGLTPGRNPIVASIDVATRQVLDTQPALGEAQRVIGAAQR